LLTEIKDERTKELILKRAGPPTIAGRSEIVTRLVEKLKAQGLAGKLPSDAQRRRAAGLVETTPDVLMPGEVKDSEIKDLVEAFQTKFGHTAAVGLLQAMDNQDLLQRRSTKAEKRHVRAEAKKLIDAAKAKAIDESEKSMATTLIQMRDDVQRLPGTSCQTWFDALSEKKINPIGPLLAVSQAAGSSPPKAESFEGLNASDRDVVEAIVELEAKSANVIKMSNKPRVLKIWKKLSKHPISELVATPVQISTRLKMLAGQLGKASDEEKPRYASEMRDMKDKPLNRVVDSIDILKRLVAADRTKYRWNRFLTKADLALIENQIAGLEKFRDGMTAKDGVFADIFKLSETILQRKAVAALDVETAANLTEVDTATFGPFLVSRLQEAAAEIIAGEADPQARTALWDDQKPMILNLYEKFSRLLPAPALPSTDAAPPPS
jgi:hypothetical protein